MPETSPYDLRKLVTPCHKIDDPLPLPYERYVIIEWSLLWKYFHGGERFPRCLIERFHRKISSKDFHGAPWCLWTIYFMGIQGVPRFCTSSRDIPWSFLLYKDLSPLLHDYGQFIVEIPTICLKKET